MRTTAMTVFVLMTVLVPTTRADDKGRFGLAKLNPFKKKEDPAAKTKLLVETLRTDPDEKKRKAAAEELRETEAKFAGEAMPVLVASLKQDPSAAVRASVAESIGKLKPTMPSAGVVLEAAAFNDPSEPVRKAAQVALATYQANGYKPSQPTATAQTNEPPYAKPRPFPAPQTTKQIVAPATPTAKVNPLGVPSGINRGPQFGETGEPPLAKPKGATFDPPLPTIPVPQMPVETPKVSPPTLVIPAPLPIPSAPKLPATPPMAMPKATGIPGAIPTPPPTSNPGF